MFYNGYAATSKYVVTAEVLQAILPSQFISKSKINVDYTRFLMFRILLKHFKNDFGSTQPFRDFVV